MDNKAKKAKEFAKKWQGRGQEKSDAEKFWYELLEEIFDVKKPYEYMDTQKPAFIGEKSYGYLDGYISDTKIIIEQKTLGVSLFKKEKKSDGEMLTPFEQAKRYNDNLITSEKANYIIVSNFETFLIYDMTKPRFPYVEIKLKDLEKEYYRLEILTKDVDFDPYQKENEISVDAGRLVGKLYDAVLNKLEDKNDKKQLEDLNVLLVRLVFLFFAEDSGIFRKNQFIDLIKDAKAEELNAIIAKLFKILATNYDKRGKYETKAFLDFPYVNGGLFEKDIEIPYLDERIKNIIVYDCGMNFDWETINPTIFGAAFESTLDSEQRRSGGMHYTSLENIHKVIYPLFMNDLEKEFESIKKIRLQETKKNKLEELRERIGALRFLDPACGSGNFLTETFILLRDLENRILNEEFGTGEGEINFKVSKNVTKLKVSIQQFYGIEINDFAVAVAKTALWIAEWQTLKSAENIFNDVIDDYLPLETYNNIYEANALTLDWNTITSDGKKVDFIMGNPPFIGARVMKDKQKQDLKRVFDGYKNVGNLDFVCCWYKKACDYIRGTDIKCALVSSNSITQGEQVSILWKQLKSNYNIQIDFAYTTFIWNNDSTSKGKAAVHCVIIGFSNGEVANPVKKLLFDEKGNYVIAKHINGYLTDAKDIYVESKQHPICNVPEIGMGNQLIDNNNYLFIKEEYEEFIKKEPNSKKYFHIIYGAEEFINNEPRYCLYLEECSINELKSMPLCLERVENVRKYRLTSKRKATLKLADKPTRFGTKKVFKTNFLIVPSTSSENRAYIPLGFLTPDKFVTHAAQVLPDATLYHFGILTSNVHMSWVRAVAGRHKSDYRYSKDIVYNNYPWPNPTHEQKKRIEETAKNILNVRELYKEHTLAELYKIDNMKNIFKDLEDAHIRNNMAVLDAYGITSDMNEYHNESAMVAHLFKLYSDLTKQ